VWLASSRQAQAVLGESTRICLPSLQGEGVIRFTGAHKELAVVLQQVAGLLVYLLACQLLPLAASSWMMKSSSLV